MEMTEENLKIENDTFALKREYKYALENLTNVKKDTVAAITMKDSINTELLNKKSELQDILNKISDEKVRWAQHRNTELMELENKQSEVENVLKRKSELNEQEEETRQLLFKNEKVINENRQLEFKMSQDKTALEVEDNKLKNRELEMTRREEKLEKNKANFKEKVVGVLKEAENL